VIAAVLAAVIFALWAITTGAIRFLGTDDDTDRAPTTRSGQPTSGSTKTVTDGDLDLRLQSLRPSGPDKLVVTVVVRNRTAAFVSFYGEHQELISTTNHTVRGAVALTSLEPRETATVDLVFSIPDDFRAGELELHAAPGSPGVRIPLD
jgi:hypothetical protein